METLRSRTQPGQECMQAERLVETAKANGVEPQAYLSLLFDRLPLAANVQDFGALLPWNLSADSGAG
jgi:hypothetical protein